MSLVRISNEDSFRMKWCISDWFNHVREYYYASDDWWDYCQIPVWLPLFNRVLEIGVNIGRVKECLGSQREINNQNYEIIDVYKFIPKDDNFTMPESIRYIPVEKREYSMTKAPIVVLKDLFAEPFVIDGNHRVTEAVHNGHNTIQAKFINWDFIDKHDAFNSVAGSVKKFV